MISSVLALSGLLAAVRAQQVGVNTPEVHPALTVSTCTASGCTAVTQSIVVDANWRWLHQVGGYTNCYTGNTWNTAICTNGVTCAANCALEGASYASTYGITTSGNALRLNFVTVASQTNVGSRTYLMAAGSTTQYQIFQLLNKEFTFDVDVSNLPCGLNGALYFAEMDADGGLSKYPGNTAGAKYGTGYCDAQCPQDIKFINGEANSVGWTPSSNDVNAGAGQYGSCCNEMDIWEANKISTAYTPHPCSVVGQTRCTGTDCGIGARYSSLCDADGCDFNSYRMGNTSYYGAGLTVNTNLPFTVVTQFITNDGTSTGTLVEIKRFYVQGGYIIPNSQSNYAAAPGNSITDSFCNAQKTAFGDTNQFAVKGGLATMGASLKKGMVLVMSIWDDHTANMLWLDAPYPPTKSPSAPGVSRGSCSASSGVPTDVEANSPNAYVIYSNIKTGPIGSTFSGTLLGGGGGSSSSSSSKASSSTSSTKPASSSTSTKTSTTSSSTKSSTSSTKSSTFVTSTTTSSSSTPSSTLAPAPRWGQCGGAAPFAGPYTCQSPWVCTYSNPFYSQCL